MSAAVHAGFAMKRFEVDVCPVSYSKVMLLMDSSMMRSAPSTLGVSSLCEGPLPDWSEVVASSACSSSDQAFMSSR